jgi:hypothetical protein
MLFLSIQSLVSYKDAEKKFGWKVPWKVLGCTHILGQEKQVKLEAQNFVQPHHVHVITSPHKSLLTSTQFNVTINFGQGLL